MEPASFKKPVGVIVAGGLSSRMGSDKGRMPLAGRPLIAHVEETVRPQVAALVLNVNGDAEAYGRLFSEATPVLADAVGGFVGPLAGILTGLTWAARHEPECRWVMSVPGDTPFLPDDLAARLTAAAESEGADVACARSRGRLHPVAAVWRPSLASDMAAYLAGGDRKVELFLRRYKVAAAEFSADLLDPFFNVNTVTDLEEAERLMRVRNDHHRRLRVRILIGEATTLGPGKAALLEAVGTCGSISGAARELGMS
ncbi:MAG: molybdenum cofactor guanylyltransferase MobA, partial [Alphaproteobacteria bacterium]|nr:molybdenum cofactor guanylyltransferase MobA [Alphaproteobacteria bacterium]